MWRLTLTPLSEASSMPLPKRRVHSVLYLYVLEEADGPMGSSGV